MSARCSPRCGWNWAASTGCGRQTMRRSRAPSRRAGSWSTTMVRTVRDLALGLRPSMLDDFGLQPALEWHARDFTRRYALPADLTVSGDLSGVTDPLRHLHLPRRPGSADQLRAPRQGRTRSASPSRRVRHARGRRSSTTVSASIRRAARAVSACAGSKSASAISAGVVDLRQHTGSRHLARRSAFP